MKYKDFLFGDVFYFERGRRYIEKDQISGDIAYISATKTNNGISSYVDPPSTMKKHINKLTLSNSGSVCYCFYHDYEFVASDHVTVISIKKDIDLNKYIALYLKPIFESMRYKYNFSREISNQRLEKEYVKLPITDEGSINWDFMENYMKKIENSITFNNEYIKKHEIKNEIQLDGWKEFYIGGSKGIFQIEKGQEETTKLLKNGDYPLIGASSFNNGYIGCFNGFKKLFKGNSITVSSNGAVGKAFYQKDDFIATGDVNVLTLKNYHLNKFIALFLCVIIEQEAFKYDYSRKWGKNKMEKTIIKLPEKDGEPDYEYMEKYISSLPYAHNL